MQAQLNRVKHDSGYSCCLSADKPNIVNRDACSDLPDTFDTLRHLIRATSATRAVLQPVDAADHVRTVWQHNMTSPTVSKLIPPLDIPVTGIRAVLPLATGQTLDKKDIG